jgi:hypothetical protein
VSDHVFLAKFWPSPTTPARINVELTCKVVPESGGNRFDYWAEVKDHHGVSRGVGGTMEADSKQHADLKAMYSLVNLLGEMLADATKDQP